MLNGVVVFFGVLSDWEFEVDVGVFYCEMVFYNKVFVGSVNFYVKYFEVVIVMFIKFLWWFFCDFVIGVYLFLEFEVVFEDDDIIIKIVIEFGIV